MNLKDLFEQYNDEYLHFDRLSKEEKLNRRRDICCFLLLDNLLQNEENIIKEVEYGLIYFDINCNQLAELVTEKDILTLIRCGVQYNHNSNMLYMELKE